MKVSRILLTGRMRMNDTLPVKEILIAFEDPNTCRWPYRPSINAGTKPNEEINDADASH